MSQPVFVIAIAGHSGAGKSTLIRYLVERLGNANSLALDAYASTSIYPPAAEWIANGADPNQFKTPQFDADVTALVNGKSIIHPETGQPLQPARYLILEEPFGRGRGAVQHLVNYVVFIDTPLEVSFIRKISRKNDFLPWEDDPELFMLHLRENMDWYIRIGRKFYLTISDGVRTDCDLIVDGLLSTIEMADEILKNIQNQ